MSDLFRLTRAMTSTAYNNLMPDPNTVEYDDVRREMNLEAEKRGRYVAHLGIDWRGYRRRRHNRWVTCSEYDRWDVRVTEWLATFR